MDILRALRHHDQLPKLLRDIEDHKITLAQNLACAADEIEILRLENHKLIKENKRLRKLVNKN